MAKNDFQVWINVKVGDGTEIILMEDAGTVGNSHFVHQQFTEAAKKAADQIEKMLITQYGKLKDPLQ